MQAVGGVDEAPGLLFFHLAKLRGEAQTFLPAPLTHAAEHLHFHYIRTLESLRGQGSELSPGLIMEA
jgi:hypothetical protein